MNPTRFLSRAFSFPFQVGFMGQDELCGSTPQFSPQMQTPHSPREQEGSDGLDLDSKHSSDWAIANKTECVLISRKFPTTNLSDC